MQKTSSLVTPQERLFCSNYFFISLFKENEVGRQPCA